MKLQPIPPLTKHPYTTPEIRDLLERTQQKMKADREQWEGMNKEERSQWLATLQPQAGERPAPEK